MSKFRFLLLYVIILALSFSFCSCAKKEKASRGVMKEEERGVQQAMEEVYFQETEEGKTRYEVWAKSLDFFPGKKVLKDVRVKFYREDDALYVKGDEAEITNESGDVDMRGNVTGKSSEGVEVATDRLFWQAKDGILSTESPVKLMSETIFITGSGLETTPKLKEARIKNSVYVTFFQNITEEVPMVITSDTLEAFFGDSPRAIFERDVVVKDSRVEIKSDRLIINFTPDGRRVIESIAQGGVVIVTEDIEAECGEARLLNEQKKIILQSQPVIWHEKVKCRGERIIYLQEEKKVIVEDNIRGIFLPKSIDNTADTR